MYLGDFPISSTLKVEFNCTDATGAPVNMAGSPKVNISCDGVDTAVLNIVPSALSTGRYQVIIPFGTNLTAGHDYLAYISDGTIDSISAVGQLVARFSVQNRYPSVATTQSGLATCTNVTDSTAAILAAIPVDGGSGTTKFEVTVESSGLPLDGVDVEISTDANKNNVIARGYTNTSGVATFWIDPGTYYMWRQLARYSFPQPIEVTV